MSEQTKTIVPKLRFPEFKGAEAWEETKLGKLGELVSGLTYSPDDIRDRGLLVLRSSNVQNGEVTLDDNVYVRPDVRGANLTKPNDILICVRNGSKTLIGKNALIPEGMPLCTHGAFMTVFRSPKAKFVFQLFQTASYQKQVDGDLGATINSINGSQFIKYKFYVPKPLEQQKIADCLSSIDDLITAQNQKITALKDHKKGLMQLLFPAEGETVPKLRFPEFQDAGEWDERTLGDITSKTDRKNKEGISYPVYSINNKVGFIPQAEQFDGVDSNKRGYDITLYKIIEKNTFAYNPARINVGSIGFSGDLNNIIISSLYVCFKSTKNVDDKFLLYFFETSAFNESVNNNVEGGIRSYLFYESFSRINVVLPKKEEQQKIANCLSSIDYLIATQTQLLETYKVHKKGLMQQLFPAVDEVSE